MRCPEQFLGKPMVCRWGLQYCHSLHKCMNYLPLSDHKDTVVWTLKPFYVVRNCSSKIS